MAAQLLESLQGRLRALKRNGFDLTSQGGYITGEQLWRCGRVQRYFFSSSVTIKSKCKSLKGG